VDRRAPRGGLSPAASLTNILGGAFNRLLKAT